MLRTYNNRDARLAPHQHAVTPPRGHIPHARTASYRARSSPASTRHPLVPPSAAHNHPAGRQRLAHRPPDDSLVNQRTRKRRRDGRLGRRETEHAAALGACYVWAVLPDAGEIAVHLLGFPLNNKGSRAAHNAALCSCNVALVQESRWGAGPPAIPNSAMSSVPGLTLSLPCRYRQGRRPPTKGGLTREGSTACAPHPP
jgi:hypothetical protein